MKLQRRNTTEFKYYGYTGLESDLNDEGLHTGIPVPVYAPPVTYRGNISVPTGYAVQAFDGVDVRYSHVLVMDDPKADIRETGYIVWNGHKYDVKAVRPSLNVLSIALKERTEDNGDQYTGPDEESEQDSETEPEGETGGEG